MNIVKEIIELKAKVNKILCSYGINTGGSSSGSNVRKTSDIINDGEDGVNPFITAQDIPVFVETQTTIEQPILTGNILTLKYVGENGELQQQNIDLSGLTTIDVTITDASYNASTNIITLTDTNEDTFSIDLSEFSLLVSIDDNGIATLTQEGITKLQISKVGRTGDYNDLLNKPTKLSQFDNDTGFITNEEVLEVDTLQSVIDRDNKTNKQIVFDNKYLNSSNIEQSYPTYLGASYNSKSNIWFTGGYNREMDDNSTLTGKSNTIFAKYTGGKLTSGSNNTLMGTNAGYSLTTGVNNTYIGSLSGAGATASYESTGSYNTGVGVSSLNRILDGFYNTALGSASLSYLTTGVSNSAFGYYSLNTLTTGVNNTAMGVTSGNGTLSGTGNIFIGSSSGGSLSNYSESSKAVRNYNIFIGKHTGILTQGSNNVFIGNESGRISTGNSLSTVNNKLVIHSEVTAPIGSNGSTTAPLSLINTLNTGLIVGDFAERWVKVNGGFSINPSYIPNASGDATFTKQIVAKDDGTFGWENKPKIKVKPSLNINSIKKVENNYIIKIVVSNINASYSAGAIPADYKLVFRYNTITGEETIINNASILDWHTYYTNTFIYTYCVVLAVPVSALSSEYNSDIVGTTMRNLYIEWSGMSKSTITNDEFYKAANALFY